MGASSSGVKKDALGISGTNSTLAGNAASTINPIYAQEANSPTGYTPQQRANQLTASSQALGGGMASAVGQGNLMAARTNNAGGSNLALDDAARNASATQSQNALGVENDNAQLMEKQKQEGLAGLNSVYDTGTGASISALNAANQAQRPFWQQLALQGTAAAGQAAEGYYGGKGCWVAAEVFGGWYEPRTIAVREWLFTDFRKHFTGRILTDLYLRFGERTAAAMRKHSSVRWFFTKVCNLALRQARKA